MLQLGSAISGVITSSLLGHCTPNLEVLRWSLAVLSPFYTLASVTVTTLSLHLAPVSLVVMVLTVLWPRHPLASPSSVLTVL